LREEIKLKIQDFEERKNKFLEDLKAKDEETKQKNLGLMDKLKQIESNAKEYFFVKQELEQTLKNENEARIQLTFYSQKTGDFELTLEKTCSMLQKFEKEVEKVRKNKKKLTKFHSFIHFVFQWGRWALE
jgi:chromosome segregation ATPase